MILLFFLRRRSGYHSLSIKSRTKELPPRNDILYNHNPKAAGSYIINVLRHLKAPGNFTERKERQSSGERERQRSFVIGSVREPCSHLVSLWGFGSLQKGGFFNRARLKLGIDTTQEIYGRSPPFGSPSDVERFRKFAQHPAVKGYLTATFVHSYTNLTNVDCFVRAEASPPRELRRCLEMYRLQNSNVSFSSEHLLEVLGNASRNAGNHSSCGHYFDADTARTVEDNERPLFEAFGWEGCCSTAPKYALPPDF